MSVQYPFLTLDICVGFFFQLLPLLVDLHDLIPVGILLGIVLIQAL